MNAIVRYGMLALAMFAAPAALAETPPAALPIDMSAYRAAWADPATERRIEEGIERNRKNRLTVRVIDSSGRPVKGARVTLHQTRQSFQFGANGFMVDGFADPAKNRLWENRFAGLFNLVTAPLYWKDFEPQRGEYRLKSTSPAIYRRPPPESVLAFADRWGIEVKGHTILWKEDKVAIPSYWPKDDAARLALLDERAAYLARTFTDRIRTWDVVNEVIRSSGYQDERLMPQDYVFEAFRAADRHFPATAELVLNEATREAWDQYAGEQTPFFLLAQGLIARGARIDGIGLQMHYFSEERLVETLTGKRRTPQELFRTLDLYARLGRPLHISEITVPTLPEYGGEAMQAELARNFYRLWFSHPAVASIIWWNLADGTALANEERWNGGLVRKDSFEKKPAYRELEKLITHDWVSNLDLATAADGTAGGRVFHGTYAITVEGRHGRVVSAATVDPGLDRTITVTVR